MEEKESLLYNALEAHYKAEAAAAKATLAVYFSNAVGIGEHPQMVEEMTKQVDKLEHAEGCLSVLEKFS